MRAVLAALLVLAGGCGCDSHCLDSLELRAQVTGVLSSGTITMCVNAACASGTYDASSGEVALTGDFYANAFVSRSASESDVDIVISGGNGSHHDGDVWRSTIMDDSAGLVFSFAQTVTYPTTEDGCGGPDCHQLTLGVSP